MSNVILNYASGKWYPKGQDRLIESVQDKEDCMWWRRELPSGSPSHEESPYEFKIHAFRAAQAAGFRFALWLDASTWVIRDLAPVWKHIEEHGYLFVEDGNKVGNFCTDAALEIMGLDRDEAMTCLIPVGAFIGLNLHDEMAIRFLDEWLHYAKQGAFKGPHRNIDNCCSHDPRCIGHRHDIAVAGVILKRLGMTMQKPPTFYSTWSENPAESVCIFARGM